MERIKSMNNLSDQQKGSFLAFVAVMFITPDSLFIRLSNVDTWGLVFYRGFIPFCLVLVGMLIVYKLNFFKMLFTWWNGKTLGTLIFTWTSGIFVGVDSFGNKFYKSKNDKKNISNMF